MISGTRFLLQHILFCNISLYICIILKFIGLDMKRILLTALALITGALALAQDWKVELNKTFKENFPYKYEVRLGWSGYPILDAETFPKGYFGGHRDYDIMPYYPNSGDVNALYGTAYAPEYMTGMISGGSPWLSRRDSTEYGERSMTNTTEAT